MADNPMESSPDGLPPPLVRLRLDSTPETLTLVRGVLGALSELLSLDAELLDDMKTAISEACNNVVLHAYGEDSGPLEVGLHMSETAIDVVIRDEGVGIPEVADPEEGVHGVGMPLIKALSDRVEFRSRPGGGTEVRMQFMGRRASDRLFSTAGEVAPEDAWIAQLEGDVVTSLSPVTFLGPVLGRLARALAARARFSLDRFSDVYLVTDAIAAHTAQAAHRPRIAFAIVTASRRLVITLGPLRQGSADTLRPGEQVHEPASALSLLSDTVRSRALSDGELLEVVMTDEPGRMVASQIS